MSGMRLTLVGARSYRCVGDNLSRRYTFEQGQWTTVEDAGDLDYLLNQRGTVLREERDLGNRCLRYTGTEPRDFLLPVHYPEVDRFEPGQIVSADGPLWRCLRDSSYFESVPLVEMLDKQPDLTILFVRHGGMGDIFLSMPCLTSLRRMYPECQLHYATAAQHVRLFDDNPDVVCAYDVWGAYEAGPFGLVVDWGAWVESAPGIERYHRSDIFAHALGIPQVDTYQARYTVHEDERATVRGLLAACKHPVYVQTAGSINRRMPSTGWLQVLASKLVEAGFTPVLGGAPGTGWEQPGVLNLEGKTNIPEMVALLEMCEVSVCGDSGPLHAANAIQCPVVALFGPVDPDLRVGGMPNCRVLTGNKAANCPPCNDFQLHQCVGQPHCLELIDQDEVVQTVQELSNGS